MDIHQVKDAIRQQMVRFDTFSPPRPTKDDDVLIAQEALAGRVRFNMGTSSESVEIGREGIDWAGGHIHHQEWPTQMGRFFMLSPLVFAYRKSPQAAYAQAARDYISDWMNRFDVEDIKLRGNTCMDIAIRLGMLGQGTVGWTRALATFMDEPCWDDAFIRQMLASIDKQAHILWKRGIPSRQFGNHRIFGLDGLLNTALRLPFMKDAQRMVSFARLNLEHAFEQQFMPDGSYVEQTLGYHWHMAGIYVYLYKLAKHFPEMGMTIAADKLLKAAEYTLHTLPGGINDTSANTLDLDHEETWRSVRKAIADINGQEPALEWRPACDVVYPNAGQVFLRSSWEKKADYLAFDASVYSGAHAHLARLGLVFRSGGRLWLADPGTFDYEMSNPFAIYGRSTQAHCTANIQGLNQGRTDARLVRSDITNDAALLHGIYDGSYWTGEYTWGFAKGLGQGTYGRHERVVLWIRDEYLLIFDAMLCEQGLQVEHVWQMAPVAGWQHDAASHSWTTQGETPGFHLQMLLSPASVEMTVYEGSKEPMRGWFATQVAKDFTPAPQIVYRYPADMVLYPTLAMPLSQGKQPPVVRQVSSGRDRAFALDWPDGTTDVVAMAQSLGTMLDDDGVFESDSPLVWARIGSDGKMQRHVKYGGSFARLRENATFK